MVSSVLWGLLKLSPLIIGGAGLVLLIFYRPIFDRVLDVLQTIVNRLFKTTAGNVTLILAIFLFTHFGAYRWGVRHERNDNNVARLERENAQLKHSIKTLEAAAVLTQQVQQTAAMAEAETQEAYRAHRSSTPVVNCPYDPADVRFYDQRLRGRAK